MTNCAKNPKIQTNPRYPTFTQAVYTAGDVDQFNSARKRSTLIPGSVDLTDNIFSNEVVVLNKWSKYANLSSRSVINTFKYLFFKFKKGLFVRIENNVMVTFLPFSNAHYKNEFASRIKVDPKYGSIQSFLDHVSKLAGYRPSKALPVDEWFANNAMFRFEYQQNEGDNNVVILKDMFEKLCASRQLCDIEFFVNRRDYPLLKTDGTEPYNHIYDSSFFPLVSGDYDEYSPILSGSSNSNFADVLFPTYEDWARAKYQDGGVLFPDACRHYPAIHSIPWVVKTPQIVFRGSSTGAGVTPETNQRLKAFEMGENLKDLDALDIGITSWNLRPRKYEGQPYLKTIERRTYPRAQKLSLQQQSEFKYILNLEGHVAAYRLSYELSSESVVFLAKSKWQTWYSRFLVPYVHYVPVKEDLSDLISQYDWCLQNDVKCQQIAANAKKFYSKYLGVAGILDYLQKLLVDLTKLTGFYSYLPDLVSWTVNSETEELKTSVEFSDVKYNYPHLPGPRCIGRLDGTLTVFRSKLEADFTFVKNVFKNKNGSIDMYKINDFFLVRKQASNSEKQREHHHEAYIGLKAVNGLLSKIPNFAYTYGHSQFNDEDLYVEFVHGITMWQWLKSPEYSFEALISILIQINLALQMAQDFCGFVHYDLYPWNVMIQTLTQPIEIDYHSFGFPIRVKTSMIPIIIDFGKSRAVIFEEKYGLVDHGFVNLYKSSKSLDTLSLLLSTYSSAKGNFTSGQRDILLGFASLLGIDPSRATSLSKYGALFETQFIYGPTGPMTFVNFLADRIGGLPSNFSSPDEMKLLMERGNPIQTATQMKKGNEQQALLAVITHIDRSSPPTSTDAYLYNVMNNILARRIAWLETEVATKGDDFVKYKWSKVKKIFAYPQPKLLTSAPLAEVPRLTPIELDEDITPEYVKFVSKTATRVLENWTSTWYLYLESVAFGIAYDPIVEKFDAFEFFDAISSNNTALKIYDAFLKR